MLQSTVAYPYASKANPMFVENFQNSKLEPIGVVTLKLSSQIKFETIILHFILCSTFNTYHGNTFFNF